MKEKHIVDKTELVEHPEHYGGESNPSNLVDVQLVISGIEDELSHTTSVYPNPA